MTAVIFVALPPSWQHLLWRGCCCNVETLGPWVGSWSQAVRPSRALEVLTLLLLLEIHG